MKTAVYVARGALDALVFYALAVASITITRQGKIADPWMFITGLAMLARSVSLLLRPLPGWPAKTGRGRP